MSRTSHLRLGDSGSCFRVALLVALIALLVVRASSPVSAPQDLRPAFQKTGRTHLGSGKQLLDEAELYLRPPVQVAPFPLPSVSAIVPAEHQGLPPKFKGHGFHYNRPPPLA